MNDASAYRHADGEINRLPCVFARAVQARHAVCELAVRPAAHAAADMTAQATHTATHTAADTAAHAAVRARGEAVVCAQPLARAACAQLAALLREKSRFALGRPVPLRTAAPALTRQLQCGGLDGLKAVLDPQAAAPDVHRLVRQAQAAYGELAVLPWSEVVKGVAAWRVRRRPGA